MWPVTALYFGPVPVWGYRCLARPSSTRWLNEHGAQQDPQRLPVTVSARGGQPASANFSKPRRVE